MRINNCFDSHIHLSSIGLYRHLVDLSQMSSSKDVLSCIGNRKFNQGEWVIGVGWDNNSWEDTAFPSIEYLDEIFPYNPVSFTRVDEHAMWVNSKALEISKIDKIKRDFNISGGEIIYNNEDRPTGILIDNAMNFVLNIIPERGIKSCQEDILEGVRVLNSEGFTHVRDMGHDDVDFHALVNLDSDKDFTLAIEKYFSVYDGADFENVLCDVLKAKKEKLKRVRVKGIKIFMDGALGSEGALISTNYNGSRSSGIKFHEDTFLREMITKVWENGLELAVHAIGDKAVKQIVDNALFVQNQNNITGKLAIEHVELASEATILKMKELDLTCHMQPCHFLTDGKWLRKKVDKLFDLAFPWGELERSNIPIFFGSDAPIERASISDNVKAVDEAFQVGIKRPKEEAWKYQTHPDKEWIKNCYTEFDRDFQVNSVYFDGKHIV